MKHLLTTFFILTWFWAQAQTQIGFSEAGSGPQTTLTAKLGIPFGTIAKLDAEIFDGTSLHWKVYEDVYLLKINTVNGKRVKDTVLLRFTDETGTLANDDFGLYKLIYKKKAHSLTSAQVRKMKARYTGKKLTLMAYETGHFSGKPYGDWRITVEPFFCFEHEVVVVSNLTN